MEKLHNIGIFGASSFVGESIVPLLENRESRVILFSRKNPFPTDVTEISSWISVVPIWILPQYFSLLEKYGVKKIIALSSTSRFSKTDSSDASEIEMARNLIAGEESLEKWATSRGIEWVILRPTLIYGKGRDKNIAEIIRFIRNFGFFPILGKGLGMRQPIHVEDVALACVSALESKASSNHAYNITGSETLSYREMVSRTFIVLQRPKRLVTIPLFIFKIAVFFLKFLPRYKHWSSAMAERMNRDLVFNSSEATRDFNFISRPFELLETDCLIKT